MPLRFRKQILTLAIALSGVVVFVIFGLPLPILFGPMTACLAAALLGAPLQGLGEVSVAARSVLGVAVGASITPALAGQFPTMALTIAIVPVYVILIGLVAVPFFRRVCGFDPITALYSAMPGGAADMTIFGQETGANVRQLSLVHVTRLLVIMIIAPIVLVHLYEVTLTHSVGAPPSDIPALELLLMIVAAIVGWKGGERVRLFGAAILSPLVVATILSLSGLLIGTGIGVSYVGLTTKEVRHTAAFVILGAPILARRFARAKDQKSDGVSP